MAKEFEFFVRNKLEKYLIAPPGESWFLKIPKVKEFVEMFGQHPNPHVVLDYDGTLAPFHLDPAKAEPYEGVCKIVDALRATGVRSTIATGRPSTEILSLLKLSRPIEIHGLHGWECRLENGETKQRPLTLHHHDAINKIRDWIPGVEGYGARVELKAVGMVVHWRGFGEEKAKRLKDYIEEKWKEAIPMLGRYMARYGGNESCEFRAQGRHKGLVIEELAVPGVPMVFLGDDPTDEDAFNTLKHYGDHGLSVRIVQGVRRTDADISLNPPEEMRALFLEFLASRVRAGWASNDTRH